MKRSRFLASVASVLLLAAFVLAPPPVAKARSATDEMLTPRTFIDLAKKVRPAVVSIKVNVETLEKMEEWKREQKARPQVPKKGDAPDLGEMDLPEWFKDFFEFQLPTPSLPRSHEDFFRYPYGAGTGMIIRADGYILTNRHVLFHPLLGEKMFKEGGITIVLADQREFKGDQVKFIAADSLTDLAVLKIDADNLPTVKWGDSENLEVGEWVMAVGDPLELTGSVSQGIISGREREIEIAGYLRLIQTTAVINPGNSGGPLVNLDGEVVGVNMAIASNTRYWQGVGFAIPSSVAQTIADDLTKSGHPVRGYIGIRMTDPDEFPALAAHEGYKGKKGVGIVEAYEGYPAYEAGIRPYDIIVEIDGKEVTGNTSVQRLITRHRPGDKVEFKVFRGGKVETIAVTAGEWPEEEKLFAMARRGPKLALGDTEETEKSDEKGRIGLTVETYPDDPKASEDEKGVIIRRIEAGSPASGTQPPLRVGDVIIEVEKERVQSAEKFAETVAARLAKSSKSEKSGEPTLLLRVQRGKSTFLAFLPIPTE